jgi:hypothetical protein
VINGRTYYKDVNGNYTWLATASATVDCDDTNDKIFDSRPSMVPDADHDGYYSVAPATRCVGATSAFNGRTYYSNGSGAFTLLDSAAALGSGECDDTNATIYRTVAGLYTDVDQDGWTVGTAGSQCVGGTTAAGGRTYYANSAGAFVYVGASLGNDCNDAVAATTGPSNWYPDADGDTFGANVAPTVACTAPANTVGNSTDCDDTNINIFTPRTVYTDADHDGYTVETTASSQCAGASTTINGRTYYKDAAGTSKWGVTRIATDCDDASGAVLGATNWYLDADGDTYGLLTDVVNACTNPSPGPGPGERVANSSDCNDASATVYRNVANLFDDSDHDGYGPSAGQKCVGANATFNTRVYYNDGTGTYRYTQTSLGTTDCDATNGNVFTTTPVLVLQDNDRDGYTFDNSQATRCGGSLTVFNGRNYYPSATGWWLDKTQCLNKQGSNCVTPFDADDANAGVH